MADDEGRPKRILISYSHDCDVWARAGKGPNVQRDRVRALCTRLRSEGLDCRIDQQVASQCQALCAPWKGVDLQWVQFPPGNWVAPAGSYRSGGGGNKTVGAFETDGSHGDSASRSRRAGITRVNVEQASKRLTWSPTLL
jgi:hypothetical protein